MADPHQDSGQVGTTEVHSVSDNIIILSSDNVESGIKEEMLHHHLVDGNIDSTSITYVVPTSEQSESLASTSTSAPDPPVSVALSSCPSLGLRTVSLEEFNLHSGNVIHGDITEMQNVAHAGVVQLKNERNILVNNTTHSALPAPVDVAAPDTTGTDIRINNENNEQGSSSSDNQFISISHQIPTQSMLSYSDSKELTVLNDNLAHIVHQNVGSASENNSQNQTQTTTIQLNQTSKNEASEIVEVKSHLKLHSPTVQIAAPPGIPMTPEILQSVIQQVKAQQLSHSSQRPQLSQDVLDGESGSQNNGVSFTLVSPSHQNSSAAPLGSSQNPIRIIQQGNRYTPMQQLTTEQLQQIMQVVQQQHTSNANKAQENGGTVIFNPHTNTKIMYRVIYPSELHKSQTVPGQGTYQVLKPVTLSQEQQTTTSTPHQKRPYNRKRKELATQSSGGSLTNGDEDKERGSGDAPELSKEEKEERKKHRPRTRSGRVSKPPKHMVQDYKHIHVLDWDEDYDDSDGGYSDLKHSDEESKLRQNDEGEQEVSPDLFPALGAGKPKNYKCQTCEKSYIGQAGLERHYRLAPEHRRSEDGGIENQMHCGLLVDGEDSSKEASITLDGNSRNSDPGPDISKSNGLVENFSEDSNTQDSINSIGTSSPIVRRGRGRGSYRGRWAHLKHNAHARRKNKLREFTKMCSDEDLMEVLFPRLVGCISTWEFLLMKAEKGGSRPKVDIIYKEFEDLLRPLKKVCAGYMKPVVERSPNLNSFDKVIKVTDQNLASCLGLNVGTYRVEEMLPDDSNSFSSLHNKLSAASISLSNNSNTLERNEAFQSENIILGEKRKYEITSPSKSDYIPIKKSSCLMSSLPSHISSEQSLMSLNGLQSNNSESASPQTTSSPQLSSPSIHSLQSSVSQSPTSSSSQSHPPVSYLISASTGKGNVVTSQALKSHLVPVVLNAGSGTNTVAASSSQILPVVLNPQSSRTTVSTTASSTKAGQISSLPLLLAAPGNQMQGSTIFLASGNQTASQNILVKQPSSQMKQQTSLQQQLKQKSVPSQLHATSPILKSQVSLLGATNKSNTNGTAKVSVPSASTSSIQRFDANTKPAEVKVSRKLFHEATASSSFLPITTSSSLSSLPSSSYVTSGSHLNNTILVTSPHKMKSNFNDNSESSILPSSSLIVSSAQIDSSNSYLQSVSTTCTSLVNAKRELESEVLNFNSLEFSGRAAEGPMITSVSSHHASAPVSDLNRGVTAGNDEDLDSSFDISAGVLSSIGFSGDELSSLNTSSDNPPSIPVSLPNLGVNQVNSVINEIIAPSSNDISNGVSLIHTTKTVTGNGTSMNHVNTTESPFINGSTSEFPSISPPPLKLKNNIILPGSQSSSSSFISSSSDFIHLLSNRPSSPLMSSPCKDGSLNNSTTSVSFNLTSMDNSLQSQILKSESTPSSMMDLGPLTFPDQSVEQQLNGVTSTLHSNDVDNILPEQITQSDETVNPLLELPQQLVSDMAISTPAGEEEGQLLLTEGSNIYQTDDGAWFIQSADGNTYQLQGAQGLPMETVQALLSGNLYLNGDAQTDETAQATHVMH